MITNFTNPNHFNLEEIASMLDGGLIAAINRRNLKKNSDLQRVGILQEPFRTLDLTKLAAINCVLIQKNGESDSIYKLPELEKLKITEFIGQIPGQFYVGGKHSLLHDIVHEIDETQIERIKTLSKNKSQLRAQLELNNAIFEKKEHDVIKSIRHGADVNYQSILKNAWSSPLANIMGVLLSKSDSNGFGSAIFRTLIAEGANINQCGPGDIAPLQLASMDPMLHHLVPILIESGSHINVSDAQGDTAFMQSSQCDCLDVLKVLIDAGADPLIRNKRGQNALDVATDLGCTRNISFLKTIIDGANLNNAIAIQRKDGPAAVDPFQATNPNRTHRNVF